MMYSCGSTSDKGPLLKFATLNEAETHKENMDNALTHYPNGGWNLEYWKTKPEPWIVKEVE